jgi:hypothetical protein
MCFPRFHMCRYWNICRWMGGATVAWILLQRWRIRICVCSNWAHSHRRPPLPQKRAYVRGSRVSDCRSSCGVSAAWSERNLGSELKSNEGGLSSAPLRCSDPSTHLSSAAAGHATRHPLHDASHRQCCSRLIVFATNSFLLCSVRLLRLLLCHRWHVFSLHARVHRRTPVPLTCAWLLLPWV